MALRPAKSSIISFALVDFVQEILGQVLVQRFQNLLFLGGFGLATHEQSDCGVRRKQNEVIV